MTKIGILAGRLGKTVEPQNDLRIDGSKKQFKYRKIVDLHKTFPATPAGTSNSVALSYNYAKDKVLTYIPAYEIYVKGYNGRWGIPNVQSFQIYSHSFIPYPYYSDNEYIDETEFSTTISVNNNVSGSLPNGDYPQHEIIVRLILFYDPLEEV